MDIILLVLYAVLAIAGLLVFFEDRGFERWFYLIYSLAFTQLMLGVWPGFEASTLIGFIIILIAVGLQVISKVLEHGLAKKGVDIA